MPRKPHDMRKTGTSPTFSPDDLALISESLRISADECESAAVRQARIWPKSELIERMNVYAERMRDLQRTIEA